MPYTPRSYGLVDTPQVDPMRSLSDLMSMSRQFQGMKDDRAEREYVNKERARVAEDRATLQSAQSSRLPPEAVEAQLAQLGRGDLVPVFKETWQALEASRLNLKRLKDDEQARHADYMGALAAGIKRVPDADKPMAIEWALKEAEADGHDVSPVRHLLQTQPERVPSLIDELIEKSPTQREWFAREADRKLSQEREARALRTAENVERDRVADNARQEAAAQAAEKYRAAELSISRQRESRLAATDRSTISTTAKATAERWKADALDALERDLTNPQKDITEVQLRRRQLQIENAYRAQVGLPSLQALPQAWTAGQEAPPLPAPPGEPAASAAPAVPATGKAAAVPNHPMIGKPVTLKDGTTVTIKTVYSDGTFD